VFFEKVGIFRNIIVIIIIIIDRKVYKTKLTYMATGPLAII